MLKSRHHFIVYPFFQHYTRYLLRRRYHTVSIENHFADNGNAVLLIGNHVGWWDGFWGMYLNLKVLKRKFHFMMLEEQLLKYRFFNYTGAFSVDKGSRSVVESIRYASELLNDSKNMLLMYPQGRLHSMYEHHFQFEKGIERMLKNRERKVQVVFSANLVDCFTEPKPSLSIYTENYEGAFTVEALEHAYNDFYARCLEKQFAKAENKD